MTQLPEPGDLAPSLQGEELSDDALTGGFRVYQRRRGHRYSLDDTLTAYQAACARPDARRCLDLGCGLGSVLLMLAYKLPKARLWGIEAQQQSIALAHLNVARNGLQPRVCLGQGDLRDAEPLTSLLPEGGVELVTGTPPYQPPGAGTVSPDSQRAHARVELRGGVEAYLEAGARALSAEGRMVVCADARSPERVAEGARAAGLRVVKGRLVVPAAGRKAPLFGVFELQRGRGAMPALQAPFVARDVSGRRSEAHLELRRFFDLPTSPDEPASPPQRRRGQRAASVHGGDDGNA